MKFVRYSKLFCKGNEISNGRNQSKTGRAERHSGRSGASAYRFIIVAAKRARQLQAGARSMLPTTSKKPTVAAMEEVRRGLVPYEDTAIQKMLPVLAEE